MEKQPIKWTPVPIYPGPLTKEEMETLERELVVPLEFVAPLDLSAGDIKGSYDGEIE